MHGHINVSHIKVMHAIVFQFVIVFQLVMEISFNNNKCTFVLMVIDIFIWSGLSEKRNVFYPCQQSIPYSPELQAIPTESAVLEV